MTRILSVTYSQSGQLEAIVSNITAIFKGHAEVVHERLKPVPDFPFPWKGIDFYDAMPESVKLIPSELQPLKCNLAANYDLVILGYPVWFLSPPIPLTTFLKSDNGRKLLAGKPVITVIGARNMWVNAQEDVKKMIADAGGNHVGNIALCDTHNNLVSVVTIIYWMGTGRKDRLWGIFPKPGIPEMAVEEADRFGPPILKAVRSGNYVGLQEELIRLKAVELSPNVVSTENKGKKMFRLWASFVLKKGDPGNKARAGRLHLFKWYLLFVIFVISPLVTAIFYLTMPLFLKRIKSNLKYYQSVSLK